MPRGILLVFTVGIIGYLTLGGAATADTEPAPGVLGGGLGVALGPATCASAMNGPALPPLNLRTTFSDSSGFESRVNIDGIEGQYGAESMIFPTGIGFFIDPDG